MQPLSAGEGSDGSREMSLPAVDSALDDVRPYLMADGGNVTVVEVADGIVRLRLEVHPVHFRVSGFQVFRVSGWRLGRYLPSSAPCRRGCCTWEA